MLHLNKSKLLAFYLFFTAILLSGHAFQTFFPSLFLLLYFPAAIALVLALSNRDFMDLRKTQNIALWIFFLMILCTTLVGLGNGLSYYIQLMCMILTAYLIAQFYSFKKVASIYLHFTTFATVVALIGYFLCNNTNLLDFLPTMANLNDVEYKIGGIFNYIVIIPFRNCGMFWEPGVFATHLILSIVLELLVSEKTSWLRLILFSFGIFTANSSAGYALWFLCVILLFVRKRGGSSGLLRTVFSVFILVFAVSLMANFDAILEQTALGDNEFFAKLSSDGMEESARYNAMLHNLESFATAPIFGVGYQTAMKNIAYTADTATSTFLLSVFGILGLAYTVFIVYGVFKIKGINLFSKILLLSILLLIVNKEPHLQILSSWILIFYLTKGLSLGGKTPGQSS